MTKEQWTELADQLDCVLAGNLEDADVLFRVSDAIRRNADEIERLYRPPWVNGRV